VFVYNKTSLPNKYTFFVRFSSSSSSKPLILQDRKESWKDFTVRPFHDACFDEIGLVLEYSWLVARPILRH
jgi:hypothetical protein